jgi:hypothetical protein
MNCCTKLLAMGSGNGAGGVFRLYFPGRVSICTVIELGNPDSYTVPMQIPHSSAVTVSTSSRARRHPVTREPTLPEPVNL